MRHPRISEANSKCDGHSCLFASTMPDTRVSFTKQMTLCSSKFLRNSRNVYSMYLIVNPMELSYYLRSQMRKKTQRTKHYYSNKEGRIWLKTSTKIYMSKNNQSVNWTRASKAFETLFHHLGKMQTWNLKWCFITSLC